jgi:thioredoxin reductase (NADPH)
MGIPGEDLPHVSHYYRDPYAYAFQRVVVVGASNSAVDAALECWRRGAEVSMVVRASQIGERVKYWVRPDILNRIAEGSIRAFFNSRLAAVEPGRVQIESPEGMLWLDNDFVLALTGYLPDFGLLRRLGVQLSADANCRPQYDPQTMETNRRGLYLAGVVCGGTQTHEWFIENSRAHARLIMAHISGRG